MPSSTRDDGSTIIKSKNECTEDDYEMLKRVLYTLQYALNVEIFGHVCHCETARDLCRKLALLYEEASQENPNSSRRDNMLSNLIDKKEITHFYLMANEEVKGRDASDNDNGTCTSDDEEEDEEMEYDIQVEVCYSLHNCSKHKLIKVLPYYIRRQE